MQDKFVRERDEFQGCLTQANVDDVALRLKEMFVDRRSLVVIVADSILWSSFWPEVREGQRVLTVTVSRPSPNNVALAIESSTSTFYAAAVPKDWMEAAKWGPDDLSITQIRFKGDRFDCAPRHSDGRVSRFSILRQYGEM